MPPVRQANDPVSESSPFKSVENRSGVLDLIGKRRITNPTKNFFISNRSFLRTLGEAHDSWIFGALAELIDNSRDAGASRYAHVFSNQKMVFYLLQSFLDLVYHQWLFGVLLCAIHS